MVRESVIPSIKNFYLMNAVKNLYEKVGKDVGLDDFFPHLVYCVIECNVKEIYAHIHYINLFKRDYENGYNSECRHGFQITIECKCLISEIRASEEEYYFNNDDGSDCLYSKA